MNQGYEIIKKRVPRFTSQNYKHYMFWKENKGMLEEILDHLILSKSQGLSEVDSLKRLGKLEWILEQRTALKMYDHIIKGASND